MYYLYIDESGDDGDYRKSSHSGKNRGSSRFFTLGGIIVDDVGKTKFAQELKGIVSYHLGRIQLSPRFILHYYELREEKPPFNQLTREQRYALSNDVFNAIINIPCTLLSVTIDLQRHCKKYRRPVNVRAYSLLVMLERFQYFLEAKNDKGEAIYEEFTSRLQKKAEIAQARLHSNQNFPSPTKLTNIEKQVKRGLPLKEPMLQFADFFAYAPYIRLASNYKKAARWKSVQHKYYNLHGRWLRTGCVEIV